MLGVSWIGKADRCLKDQKKLIKLLVSNSMVHQVMNESNISSEVSVYTITEILYLNNVHKCIVAKILQIKKIKQD